MKYIKTIEYIFQYPVYLNLSVNPPAIIKAI